MFKTANCRISAVSPNTPFRAIASPTRCFTQLARPALHLQHACPSRPKSHPILRSTPYLHQSRSYTYYQRFRDNFQVAAKDVHRKHPIGFPLSLLFAAGSTGVLFYFIYDYVTHVNPQYEKFPPQVADQLRKAIYYKEIDSRPGVALNYYKRALIAADQLGMHPFSDEVLGIRLHIPLMLEQAGLVKAAIEVLEKTEHDCQEWVDNGRRRQLIKDREQAGNDRNKAESAESDSNVSEEDIRQKEAEEEKLRNQVMKRVAGVWLKLAELYSSKYVQNMEKAENALISAVSCSRTELQRRRDLNLPLSKDAEGTFLNLTDAASTFNELADLYSKKGRNDLASALYMQSLSLIKEDEEGKPNTCAQVVLLNNISSQMAEQAQKPILPPSSPPQSKQTQPPVSREQLLYASTEWANKALDVASNIKPPIRNEECDQTCLAALYNLGEISEMQENFKQAEDFYERAKASALELKISEGVEIADEALSRLKQAKK